MDSVRQLLQEADAVRELLEERDQVRAPQRSCYGR